MGIRETTREEARPSWRVVVSPLLSRSFSDPEELAEVIPEVDGEFVQVSPGAFRAQVSRVALSTGCTHLGRFASEYRALFGELPSVTLSER